MKPRRLLVLIVAGIAGAAAITAGYWTFRTRQPSQSAGSYEELDDLRSSPRDFDRTFELPISPLGAAWDGQHLIIGNRSGQGSVLRVRREGLSLEGQTVPIIEPRYQQQITVSALTWDGERFVGIASAAWFQKGDGDVFTIHDGKSLQILDHKPAPPKLGCLAWDGESYWAATRKNTEDSPEPALLYMLDEGLNVVSTTEAPGLGCQGMAWDGQYLWLADVFSDSITILDIETDPPSIVKSTSTAVQYLSGIVAIDDEIWVTEYDDNRLHRLKPETRVAWAGAPAGGIVAASAMAISSGESILVARDQDQFAEREPEDTDAIDWQMEIRDDAIYGSWQLWFGPDLFSDRDQDSNFVTVPKLARYTFTIRDPSGQKTEREFEATAGENIREGVWLLDASDAGEYQISLFIHVQYVDAEGTGRILNNSEGFLTLRK